VSTLFPEPDEVLRLKQMTGLAERFASRAALRPCPGCSRAPGLKRWVLNTMSAASSAHTTAYAQECAVSGLASAIIAYQQVFDKAARVFKQIVGVVVAAGDAVLHLREPARRAHKGRAPRAPAVVRRRPAIRGDAGLAQGSLLGLDHLEDLPDITLRDVAAQFGLPITTVHRTAQRLRDKQRTWPEDEVTC